MKTIFWMGKLLRRSVALLIGFLAISVPAWANMDQSMTAQFNAMINVTPGGVYETQGARVITGGGFVYRPRVSKLQLISVDPPRLRANCNGIDAYSGSLSFISKEAFINFLRGLAAAAPSYAFNLALSYLCKDCDQHLARLQKLAQDMNSLTVNTCKIDAGDLSRKLSTIKDDISDVGESAMSLGAHWTGLATDAAYARDQANTSWNKLWDASKAGNPDAQKRVAKTYINVAWDASRQSALAQWWGSVLAPGDDRLFYETLLSYTGTIITMPVPSEDDPAVNKPQTKFLDPLLNFNDFLNGGIKEIYKCPPAFAPTDDTCLFFPTEANKADTRQTITLPSFRQKVRDILIGTPGIPGIVYRINARESAGGLELTPSQKEFIVALPGGVYAQLREIAAYPQSAVTYAETLSDWIAVEMTYQYLAELLRNARISANTSKADLQAKEWSESLGKHDADISRYRAMYTDSLRGVADTLTISAKMREAINRATAHGIRPGQFGPQN